MKGTKELLKVEPTRLVSPFEEVERWFDWLWRRPLSGFRAPFRGTGAPELEEFSPVVDVYETEHELIVKCDLPGVKKDDIKLDIAHNYLTITGEKKMEEKSEKINFYRYESTYGNFSRSFELPEGLDTDKARARYENGILEIKIPKSAAGERISKTIPIQW